MSACQAPGPPRNVKKCEPRPARRTPNFGKTLYSSVSCHTPCKEVVMIRSSIVCVPLLLAGSVSVARADVEFAVPDKKAAPTHPVAAAPPPGIAAPAAPAPVIADNPGMAPPVVPGKQPP